MTRTNSEVKSMLPKFNIGKSEDFPDYLIVLCTRNGCPSHTKDGVKPFIVHQRAFQRPKRARDKKTVIRGRPCPYCSRVSAIR